MGMMAEDLPLLASAMGCDECRAARNRACRGGQRARCGWGACQAKARRTPLVARVVSWLNLCRVCQDFEEEMLLAPQPDDNDRRLHRALLSTALASGEGLLLECDDAEDLKALRLTAEALAAKVESLRITFTQWHTELKPERQATILREAFGAQV